MKQTLFLFSGIVAFLSIAFLQINSSSNKRNAFDKPGEAIEHEFMITKDPKLGRVPRERLLIAMKQLNDMQAKKTRGAIAGVLWEERGPNNIGGRTRTIMIDPNDVTKKTLWAGSVGGGLWQTTDITQTNPVWNNNNDFLDNLAISSMAFDPSNTQKFYAVTGEGRYNGDAIQGLGVFISTNGGTTWNSITSTLNNTDFNYCQKVVVTSVGTVLVATETGIWRTTAPVTTASIFTKVTTGSDFYSDIEISAPGSTIYASSGRFFTNNGNFFRSIDDGATWNSQADFNVKAGTVDRVDIACNGNNVYAVCQSSTGNGAKNFLHSSDGGINWTLKTKPTDADPGIGTDFTRSQAWYDFSIEVDPNNANNVWVGGIDMFKSTNNGTTWNQITHWYGGFGFQFVHADQHIAMYEPGNSNVMYLGNDGGIFRSSNANVAMPSFTEKNTGSPGNKGYNVTQFYACATKNEPGSNYFLAGAQDNGSQQFTTAGMNSTVDVNGGDGCFCFVDQTNSLNQIVTYVRNNISVSTDGGTSFNGLSTDNSGSFVNPMDLADGDNRLYSGRNNNQLIRWSNIFGAVSKTTLSINLDGSSASHVKVSPNNNQTVYVGTNDGGIFRITNAHTGSSPTITNLGSPWSGVSVSCIEVWKSSVNSDDSIVATVSNYGVANSVIFTSNGTSATPTWTNLDNASLPDMPIRWAVYNPTNKNQVLLATELGVWSTDNLNGGTTNWGPTNTGLANVKVNMIKVRRSDNRFVAATHGRGLFTSNSMLALPVLWGSLNALAIDNKKVELNWSTQVEQNTALFTIERSRDGVNFTSLATHRAKGNTEIESFYNYMDLQPMSGINYYRLKIEDIDGKKMYSKVVTATIETYTLDATLYPNPATDFVKLAMNGLKGTSIQYSIYNNLGRLITNRTMENTSSNLNVNIDLSSVPSGIYFIELSNGGQKIIRQLTIQ